MPIQCPLPHVCQGQVNASVNVSAREGSFVCLFFLCLARGWAVDFTAALFSRIDAKMEEIEQSPTRENQVLPFQDFAFVLLFHHVSEGNIVGLPSTPLCLTAVIISLADFYIQIMITL